MLTDTELQQLFERLQVPELGRARIRHIRDNPPSRVVLSNKASGKTRYTPLKMPFVIEAEAVSTEYVAIVDWDHDKETLEYYPQPKPLTISYLTANRMRRVTIPTTPDCLRITAKSLVFVECKREEELEKLHKKMPGRYQRDPDGRWRSAPAEAATAALGCEFEIRSSRQNNWVLHENLELLKDYHIGQADNFAPELLKGLQDRLSRAGWISVFELVHQEPAIPADFLYALIATRQVYYPIEILRLSDQERAFVFRDETTFSAREAFVNAGAQRSPTHALGIVFESGAVFDWDGAAWQILNDGAERLTIKSLAKGRHKEVVAELDREQMFALVAAGRIKLHRPVSLETEQPDGMALLCRASTTQLKQAIWRLEVLENRANPVENPYAGRKLRARLYWKHRYREAEVRYGNGLVGLLPLRSGNRKPKASPATLALANEVIASDWETIRRKRRMASWGRYRVLASTKGLDAVSYTRFCQLVKARSGHRQLVNRIGEKAAYDLEPHYLEMEWTTPRHGVRPWHICHIDHTPLPLMFVHNNLKTIASTIWMSILTDANTRKILAFYLSFDPPSYRSCMMVLRDCVRRHHRVPQILVCDQGSDFKSIYFETLLASLGITKRERRAGKPKAGSVCERIFNTSQSQFVKVLMGSTDLVENYFRSISPEVDPARHAIWTMERFDEGFEKYLSEVYHVNHHTGLGMSPNAAWAFGLRSHGLREHRAIPYDKAFIMASCPAVRKGKARVTPAGIKINYRWFNCIEFQTPGVLGANVEARYDPFNAGIAYAYVSGQWHTCHSEHYPIFSKYGERAVWLATESLKLKNRKAAGQLGITAERLALFLEAREHDEALTRQLRNDAEATLHRQKIHRKGSVSNAGQPTGLPPPLLPTAQDLGQMLTPATAQRHQLRHTVRTLEDLL